MSNTKWVAARRAWKILSNLKIQAAPRRRRRPFAVDLRRVRRFIERLAHPITSTPTPTRRRPHYAAERQFSFHETPNFHRKFHRRPPSAAGSFHLPRLIPCADPKVVESDCALERCGSDDGRRRLGGGGGGACDCEEEEGDCGIDLRAEKFINMFYEEMKLQNQFSYLAYDEFSDSD